jgi:hypothetical protein
LAPKVGDCAAGPAMRPIVHATLAMAFWPLLA